MKPLAFISYSENGGSKTSADVAKRLRCNDLGLITFCSQFDINTGDDIHEEIICNIVNADIFIGVIDSGAPDRSWVEWEYNFCKERNLIQIPIIFSTIWTDFTQNEIPFIDKSIKAICHDTDNKDKLLDNLFSAIRVNNTELTRRCNDKEQIQITLNPIGNGSNPPDGGYQSTDTIKISGHVKFNVQGAHERNLSKIYRHQIDFTPNTLPIKSKTLIDHIDLDEDGGFSYDVKLSEMNNIDRTQKLFFEIQFNDKSKIISITICPPRSDTGGILSPENPSSSIVSSDSFNSLRKRINTISEGTYSSISKYIKDYSIDRKQELSELAKCIEEHDKTVITGDKGSGKSVILCELYIHLKENKDILFVRCDDYLYIKDMSELETIICKDKSVCDIIQENYSSDNKLLVFFDSLDAISRNSRVFEIFKRFLKQLWGTGKIKTICSVRDYDYRYSYSISSTDWGKNFQLGKLSDEQLEQTLDHLNCPQISKELSKILKNPLNLQLFSLIYRTSNLSDLHSMTSEIDLYNEHWKKYVEKSEDPQALKEILFSIVKEMIEKQRIIITIPDNCSQTALMLALSGNLLKRDSVLNTIRFFHHAYMDYVASRYLLENFENLDEFIIQQKYNIFLRPTIGLTLSILQMKNQKLFLSNVKRILSNSEIKYYWKLSVLHVFSRFETNEYSSKIDTFGELFNENLHLRRHFLRESAQSENQFWFKVWKDSFIQDWANDLHANNIFLLEYFKSILSKIDHMKLFELLQIIVEKSDNDWTKKTAVEIASELNVEKSDWYLRLSNDKNSFIRWGVIVSLSKLTEDGTKNLNKIFSNIVLFKETSEDATALNPGNSIVFQSNKKQDNMQNIWMAEENFNKLLEKLPGEFLLSVVAIIQDKQKDYSEQKDTIVEDGGYFLYESNLDRSHGMGRLFSDTEHFLVNCETSKLKELIPIFTETRFATLHKIAITAMLNKMDSFKDAIYLELLIPEIYKIETLRIIVNAAIKKISPLLSDLELKPILKCIMEISFPENRLDEEQRKKYINLYKASFLSSIPVDRLSSEQKELLEIHPQKELKEFSKPNPRITIGHDETFSQEKKTPKDIIDLYLGQDLHPESKIKLLNAICEYLGSKTKDLDTSKFSSFKTFLLSNIPDQDPKENSVDENSSPIFRCDIIRGLTSRCLIRLYHHSTDEELTSHIEKLIDDKINIVRANIAQDLRYLYSVNPTLTIKTVMKYSQESDNRIQFHLTDVVSALVNKHPQETIDIIENIIKTNKSKNSEIIQPYINIIMSLSLIKKNPIAESILTDLITKPDFPYECRESIPFILKESYLYNKDTQDASLKIFSDLLNDKNHVMRETAAFFLLATINDEKSSDAKNIIKKIGSHLDKIAKEIEREKYNLRMIEILVRFLEKNWKYLPEKSVKYMQIISEDDKKYLQYRSQIADGIIVILNGLFREDTLNDENKQHCLDILDKFAMAGWPEAIELFDSMERSD